jgi:hypothetical protein
MWLIEERGNWWRIVMRCCGGAEWSRFMWRLLLDGSREGFVVSRRD